MGGTGFAAIIHHLFCAQCCLPALRLQCYQGYTDYMGCADYEGYEGYVGYMGCEETERRSAINLCHYTLIWKAGEHRATSHVYHISFYWKKEGYRSCLLFIVLEKRGLQVMFTTFHPTACLEKRGLQVMFTTFHPTACPVVTFSVWDWIILVSTAWVHHTHNPHCFPNAGRKRSLKTFTGT